MTLRIRHYVGWPRDGRHNVVLSNNVRLGTIVHNHSPAGREWWAWHINIPGEDGPPRGTESTKEDAMRAFAAAWRHWLAEAGLAEIDRTETIATPANSEPDLLE